VSSPATDAIEHGTYRGYAKCRLRIEGACAPCLTANADYHQQHRADNPERREQDRRNKSAYYRALSRLRDRHRAEFLALYAEEGS
jgi:hypothetical protein